MSEKEICENCGQVKKKLTFFRKLMYWEISIRKKIAPKLMAKIWPTCDECSQRIPKKKEESDV